ncbi:hypothetical protein STH2722 [Symbiobacterium thermophilum IAM 14863]|uniref:Uncharacterized protein n=1 Tax=Symbiobacterium thermophilum (strain DSM 24528 / JCM 14929 / IAM 14863 / T) TaxID=292459 RepID=Q67KT9_SYMTH|nr:hypothetical protein STH2722 [Symbiobacterium thermophilum IAM 14863]
MDALEADDKVYDLPLINYAVNIHDQTTGFHIVLPENWPALVHRAVAPARYIGPVTVISLRGGNKNLREAVHIDESGKAVPAGPVIVSGRNVSRELPSAWATGESRPWGWSRDARRPPTPRWTTPHACGR